jgi:hypothetical protein
VLPPRLPRPEQLAELSDGDLADLTALLVNELQRRMTEAPGRSTRPDLKRALEQIASALQPPASKRRLPSTQEPSLPIDGKRNAIRAALLAGIKPTQVAKHFGVSLAAVRKVATQSG